MCDGPLQKLSLSEAELNSALRLVGCANGVGATPLEGENEEGTWFDCKRTLRHGDKCFTTGNLCGALPGNYTGEFCKIGSNNDKYRCLSKE